MTTLAAWWRHYAGRAENLFEFISGMVAPDRLFLWHFNEAMKQYQKANANLSFWHFHKCLKLVPEHWFAWHGLSIVYSQLIGDIEESLRLLRYARRLRERLCTPPGGKPPYRFFD